MTTRPLTVLHLTHEGRPAGSTISIALLAGAQVEAGHRVLVGCPAGSALEQGAAGRGVETVPMPFRDLGEAAAAIAALVRQERVEVVNAHSSRDRAACRRLRLAGRLPAALVMTRRGMPMSTPVSAALSGLAADRVIAVSRPVARALIRRGTPPWRLTVVHNALDAARVDRPARPEAMAAARVLVGWDPARPTIGVVARRKDHEVLVRALHVLRRPVTLVCAGFEPDPPLARLAAQAAPHRVVFLPFQHEVRALYECFDVVALASRHEGLSQGLMEAMALGKAVVATRSGGNTDLVEDGVHGLLVAPRDPEALGVALERLLGDRGLAAALGAAARSRVRGEFTIERTVAGTDAAYRAALGRRRVPA